MYRNIEDVRDPRYWGLPEWECMHILDWMNFAGGCKKSYEESIAIAPDRLEL
jgi:hypothetical protein